MDEEAKNAQNSAVFQEMPSDQNTNSNGDFGENNNKETSLYYSEDFSFSSYYGPKFCTCYFLLILFSVISIIGGFVLLVLPSTNATYLNNIRLEKTFNDWNQNNYSYEYGKYAISLKVISSSLSITLPHLDYDPLYITQSYYEPSIFYLNMSMNNSVAEDVFRLKQKMGIVDLTNSKLIGQSNSFCLSFIIMNTTNTSSTNTSFAANYSFFENLPYCSQNSKAQTKNRGIKIIPWKRKMIYNLTEANCQIKNGVYSNGVCYTYKILKKICIKLKLNGTNQIVYMGGCYEKSNYSIFFIYENALLQHTYDFSDFSIYLRHEKDPYLILMNFFKNQNMNSLQISVGFIEEFIPGSIFFGITSLIFFAMLYLLLKSEVHSKFKLT